MQRQGAWPTTATLQGIAIDLVGAHTELSLPLRELVSRPAFRSLADKAGTGGGELDRDALLLDMQQTFAPVVVAGLAEVLNGFLDLPSGGASTSMAAEPLGLHRQPVSSATESPLTRNQLRSASRPLSRTPLVLLLSLCFAALAAGSVMLLRSSPFCGAFGLCMLAVGPSQTGLELQSALAAEQALRRAASLESYSSALEQLEHELFKLSGVPLSPDQQQQRITLQAAIRDARQTLQAELADQEAVNRAVDAIAAAKGSPVAAQTPQLTAARQALDAIPPRSFSAEEGRRLRSAIDDLIRESVTQSAPPPPESSSPRWTPPEAAPQPKPVPSQPPLPNRDQPLF